MNRVTAQVRESKMVKIQKDEGKTVNKKLKVLFENFKVQQYRKYIYYLKSRRIEGNKRDDMKSMNFSEFGYDDNYKNKKKMNKFFNKSSNES